MIAETTKRIPTSILNRVLYDAVERQTHQRGRRETSEFIHPFPDFYGKKR